MVTKNEIVMAYRLLLSREPESEEAINDKLKCESLPDLIFEFMSSAEFKSKFEYNCDSQIISNILRVCLGNTADTEGYSSCHDYVNALEKVISSEAFIGRRQVFDGDRVWRFLDAPPLKVDVTVDDKSLQQLCILVEKAWSYLGKQDAYWSVMTDEQFRGEIRGETLERFYNSGKVEASFVHNTMVRNGLDPKKALNILEYGCGVGRVTTWLCRKFPEATIIGADISSPHLAHAQKYINGDQSLKNFVPHHLANLKSITALPSFDLGYSRIVLQHNPPPVMCIILDSLLKALRSNGILLIQIPVYAAGYQFDCKAYIASGGYCAPGGFELHVVPQESVMSLITNNNCRLLEVFPDPSVGISSWLSLFYVIQKQ